MPIFKKKNSPQTNTAIKHHPALGLKRQNLILHEIKGHMSFIILALGGLSFGFVSLGAYISLSQKSLIKPYVITVSPQGEIINEALVLPSNNIPKSVILSQLCNFVKNMYTVEDDISKQHQLVINTYAFIQKNTPAYEHLKQFFTLYDPFATDPIALRGLDSVYHQEKTFITSTQDKYISPHKQNLEHIDSTNIYPANTQRAIYIHILNVSELGEHKMQIDFMQIPRHLAHLKKHDQALSQRIIINYKLKPIHHHNLDSMLLNPLGILIEDFNVSTILK